MLACPAELESDRTGPSISIATAAMTLMLCQSDLGISEAELTTMSWRGAPSFLRPPPLHG
jgi:hypothetical protein